MLPGRLSRHQCEAAQPRFRLAQEPYIIMQAVSCGHCKCSMHEKVTVCTYFRVRRCKFGVLVTTTDVPYPGSIECGGFILAGTVPYSR